MFEEAYMVYKSKIYWYYLVMKCIDYNAKNSMHIIQLTKYITQRENGMECIHHIAYNKRINIKD